MLGPLIIVAVLHFHGSYQSGFAVLAIPATLTLAVLIVAHVLYPQSTDLEARIAHLETKGFATPCGWISAEPASSQRAITIVH